MKDLWSIDSAVMPKMPLHIPPHLIPRTTIKGRRYFRDAKEKKKLEIKYQGQGHAVVQPVFKHSCVIPKPSTRFPNASLLVVMGEGSIVGTS